MGRSMTHICLILLLLTCLIIGCEESNGEKGISSADNPNSNIILQNNQNDNRVGKSNQQTENQSKPTSPANQDALSSVSAIKRIHSSLPVFTFTLTVKDSNDGLLYPSDIEITNLSSGKLIQILNSKGHFDNDGNGWNSLKVDPFEFVDLNGDGYLDLRILNETGTTGNDWYATYIYMPKLMKFKYHEALSRLSGIKLDPKSKQIMTYWRRGWCSEFMEHFKIDKKGTLILNKVEWTGISSLDSDKVCFRITGIPRDKKLTNLGYNFYHGRDDDIDEFLQKKVRVIKKDIVYGDLDGRARGPLETPYN